MGKVEEVARAIYNGKPRNKPWETLPVEFRRQYHKQARAAIAAMREPDHDLTLVAVEAVHKFAHSHDIEFYRFHGVLAPDAQRVYQERFKVGFNAMIDAALSEDKEQG